MDLNRRSFLRGMLTVAALSVAPALAIHADLPRIVGDGIHDDTAGLQAALDGRPFICDGELVTGTKDIRLGVGTFRISSTLTINRQVSVVGSGSATKFVAAASMPPDMPMIYVHDVADLSGGCFDLMRAHA